MKRAMLFLVSMLIVFSLTCCGQKAVVEDNTTEIIISKDFGNEQVLRKTTSFEENDSVLDVMKENFEIETAYGGGFVNSINGLKSGFTGVGSKQKLDWFYYVNGTLAQIGADDYRLKQNDIVIWDYHDWNSGTYISSIIGAYPNNFLCDYDGSVLKTEILYDTEFKNESRKLAEFLKKKGLKDLELVSLQSGGADNENVNTVFICCYDSLSKISHAEEILNNSRRAGIFFRFNHYLMALNTKGEAIRQYEKGAVIASIGKGYGAQTGSIWLVTGNDKDCIKRATRILYEEPEKISGRFSVIVTGDEVIGIPVKD